MRKGHSWNQDLVVRDETVFITIDQAKVARKETQAALVAESQGHGAPETQPFPKDYVGFVYFSLYSHGSQGHGAPETQPFPKDYVIQAPTHDTIPYAFGPNETRYSAAWAPNLTVSCTCEVSCDSRCDSCGILLSLRGDGLTPDPSTQAAMLLANNVTHSPFAGTEQAKLGANIFFAPNCKPRPLAPWGAMATVVHRMIQSLHRLNSVCLHFLRA